ncbi:histidine kinase [Cyclobacteriaceae bacterium YHN15]|jgi:two-component system, NarL family, sensor kinase|nr:histidine kinase [Cyclobacteriaceae bacterium YHN15]
MENNGSDLFVIILLGFFLMLFMVSFIIIMVIYHRQRQIQNKQRLKSIQTEFEKTILNAEKEIREDTLTHVGRELHDNIGQLLSLAKMNLSSSKPEKVSEGKSMINQIIREVRALSKTLNLDWVDSITLEEFIQRELAKLESAEFCKTNFVKQGDSIQLDKNTKLILIRIIQECLNNAIKHAEPKTVSISVVKNEAYLSIYVKDDGKGFNINANSNGSGMSNLKNRMNAMRGEIKIRSEEGKGTEIELSLPISNA